MKNQLLEQALLLIEEAQGFLEEAKKDNPVLADKTSYLLELLKIAQCLGITHVAIEHVVELRDSDSLRYIFRVVITKTAFSFFMEHYLIHGGGRYQKTERDLSFRNKIERFTKCMSLIGRIWLNADSTLRVEKAIFCGLCENTTTQIVDSVREWSSRVDQYRTLCSNLPKI
jgi:hypothetical protein